MPSKFCVSPGANTSKKRSKGTVAITSKKSHPLQYDFIINKWFISTVFGFHIFKTSKIQILYNKKINMNDARLIKKNCCKD